MDRRQEEMIQEIRRLKAAVRETDSKYLKIDYGKRIKRMKKQLAEYRYYQEVKQNGSNDILIKTV